MPESTPLHLRTATQLAGMIRRREVSSTELTKMYLGRLTRYGSELGALVTPTPELALSEAKRADRDAAAGVFHSPLHGVPYGIKDLFSAKGYRTTWGSPVYKDRVIDEDSAVVLKLRAAGCPLLGKLSMVEFAGSAGYRFATSSLTGAGRTPWNRDHWSGGSSSGSGAATSAGLAGFTIGTETWGSILCPSAFCGVTGLRPTSGRVSRHGAMALSWTMDKAGPIARSVADCATILELISGAHEGAPDPAMRPERYAKFTSVRRLRKPAGLRLGVIRPDYGKGKKVQPETDHAFRAALVVLAGMGVQIDDTKLPDLPIDEAAGLIVTCEGAAAFEDVVRHESTFKLIVDPEMRGALVANLGVPATDYIRSLRIRDLVQKRVPEVFAKFDALVAPSYLQVSPPITANLDTYFAGSDNKISGFSNMLGLPAIGVPMGFGPGHLPLAMQIVGPPLREDTLIAIASAYQNATGWHLQHPPGYG